jgi:hypothetical protein
VNATVIETLRSTKLRLGDARVEIRKTSLKEACSAIAQGDDIGAPILEVTMDEAQLNRRRRELPPIARRWSLSQSLRAVLVGCMMIDRSECLR